MMAYYEQFFQNDPPLNVLIYSGDIDIAAVPHAKTQVCLDGLGRNVTESWSLWSIPGPALPHRPNNITARYVEVFDGIFSSLHNKFRFTSHSENAHSLVNGLVNIFSSLHINLKG